MMDWIPDKRTPYFSRPVDRGQESNHGLDEKAPKSSVGGNAPQFWVETNEARRALAPTEEDNPVQKTNAKVTNGQTDELRTLLDQAFDALEHDKSAINEKMGRIWKCKPACLKCRIGVTLRS